MTRLSCSKWLVLVLATALTVGCGSADDSSVDDTSEAGSGGAAANGASAGTSSSRGDFAGQAAGGASGSANVAGSNPSSAGTSAAGTSAVGASGSASTAGTSSGGSGASGDENGGAHSGGSNAGGMANAGAGGVSSGGQGGSSGSSCTVSPADPDATPSAKKLLCYLYSQYKNHVLSGQQETSWSNPVSDLDFYRTNTGKYPAILGGDFLYTGTTPTSQGTTTSRAQAYWAAGGIPMFRYHMGAPPNADSYENSMLPYSSAQCNHVITSGTTENNSYKSKLDYVAGNLLTLQNAGVAVILALFHETQPNGWFWWSKCSNSQFLALYKYSYDYLVSTKGVHNIVRLMPFSGSPNSGLFPGKTAVDLVGPDTYDTQPPFGSLYGNTASFVGSTIPIPLHETGTIPQPSTMFPTAAPWLLWNVWAGYEVNNNTVANIKSAYASPYTITRDELPSFE